MSRKITYRCTRCASDEISFDAKTGEPLGQAPGSMTYIPKSEADAAWEAYTAQRRRESAAQERAAEQDRNISAIVATLIETSRRPRRAARFSIPFKMSAPATQILPAYSSTQSYAIAAVFALRAHATKKRRLPLWAQMGHLPR